MPARAHIGAEIAGQCADIGPRRTIHLDVDVNELTVAADRENVEAVDAHRTRGEFDLLALADTLVGPLAADLDRTDRRRSLRDLAAQCRRIFGTRKVGHAGTLDPMATGVLVIGIERATKILGLLSGTSKSYAATIRLGRSTTTDDAEGDLVADISAVAVTDDAISVGVAALRGEIAQRPSAVSAIKVGGKRAY